MDGTLVGANASQQSRVPKESLVEAAKHSRTVQEYLTELEREKSVADSEGSRKPQEKVSTTDPDLPGRSKVGRRCWAIYDNYLVDTTSRVILSVQATPALFSQEILAARRMLEHVGQFGIHPQNLAADKAYGSGEFLVSRLAPGTKHSTAHSGYRSSAPNTRTVHPRWFRCEPQENAYYCPEGKPLHYRGQRRSSGGYLSVDRSAMPRLSTKEAMYRRPLSEIVRSLAGTSAISSSRIG